MPFCGTQVGARSRADGLEACLVGNGVLDTGFHSWDAAESVRVALAETAPPERVGLALGENGFTKEAVKRKEAGVPARLDDGEAISGACSFVNLGEVLGNLGMCVEAI